jgi:hypothetical protein
VVTPRIASGEGLYPIRISGAPAKFDPKIAAISEVLEGLPESSDADLRLRIAFGGIH